MYTKIKTFENACKALKLDPEKVIPKVSSMPKHHQDAIVAHAKLVIITEALNEGWKPNWNDSNEWKYYPWFIVDADAKRPSGFGLSYYDYVDWYSNTFVCSRLCFKSREVAKFAGKQFKMLYEQYFLLK